MESDAARARQQQCSATGSTETMRVGDGDEAECDGAGLLITVDDPVPANYQLFDALVFRYGALSSLAANPPPSNQCSAWGGLPIWYTRTLARARVHSRSISA
jgi:hypothetical protein